MVKTSAWQYLDKVVSRRRSLEIRGTIGGGYSVCLNGYHFGIGQSCRAAFLNAIIDAKKRRKMDAR